MTADPAYELQQKVGHPEERWEALKERVQTRAVKRFCDVQDDWLGLMWSLDRFRSQGLKPLKLRASSLEALNRGKGNWFAELLALLLQNRTSQHIGARTSIRGFSQLHQIDVAWPSREIDPLVCAETKVTGGPSYGEKPERGAMSDWTNRRKELKFAATDLKLYRRQQETKIEHWDVWRRDAPPKTYFLWGARLRFQDSIEAMVREAHALTDTYLDGAGIFAWQLTTAGYSVVPLPHSARVAELDDVLLRIQSEISALTAVTGSAPEPVLPRETATEPGRLLQD